MNILYPFMQFQEGYYPKKVALKQPMIYGLLQIDLSKKKKKKRKKGKSFETAVLTRCGKGERSSSSFITI